MSESFQVELGSPLPLSYQMPADASGLFPRARIYDSSDAEVAGSPFSLTEVAATARYTGASFTPLAVGTFTARFVAFTDAGHTIEALRFSRDQDSYTVETPKETEAAAATREATNTAEHVATQLLLTTTGVVLTAPAVTAIWDEDVTGRVASPNSAARIQDMQNRLMRGRIRTNPTLNRLELYDPVDDTLLLAWPLTDFGGGSISDVVGSPFDRAKAAET